MGINKVPPITIFVEYQDSLNDILLFVLSGWVQSSLQEELAPLKEQEVMQAQMAEAQRQKLSLVDGEAVDAVIRRLEGRVPDQAAKPDK